MPTRDECIKLEISAFLEYHMQKCLAKRGIIIRGVESGEVQAHLATQRLANVQIANQKRIFEIHVVKLKIQPIRE
jgi:hypothetical protein